MRLEQLTIERFKGVSHMELDLRGMSADIYGDNATGKTTIADAVTWLLFDKDTDGRKAFSVKPLNVDGTVREPGAETSVEGVFTQDGKTIVLRKTYREGWQRVGLLFERRADDGARLRTGDRRDDPGGARADAVGSDVFRADAGMEEAPCGAA